MLFRSGDMREIFEATVVVRKPTYGIVSGYHELPYICVGNSEETASKTTRVRGRIQVSPRFVLRPSHFEPSYGEIFGEENVDAEVAGRVFGFLGFQGRPVECSSDHIEVQEVPETVDQVVAESMDQLERMEDITTGVIITPDSRYYPVSIERFIASVLEDEFKV